MTGGDVLSDRRILIGNGGTLEVRVYSESGTAVGAMGGDGEGPGEFRSLASVEVGPGDSIYVFDDRLQRLTVFLPDGSLVRVTRLTPDLGFRAGSLGRLRNDRWYAAEASNTIPTGANGLGRDSSRVAILDANLQRLREVVNVPAFLTGSAEMMGQRMSRIVPFSPRALFAHTESCLFTMPSDSNTLPVFRQDGEVAGSITLVASERAITDQLVSDWAAALTDVPKEAIPAIQATLRDFPRPESLPFYQDMFADDLGHVWLQSFVPPTGLGAQWTVLGQGRTAVAVVDFREPIRVLKVRRNTVVALVRSAVGEEVVRLYRLIRPNTPAVALCGGSP